MIVNLYLRMVRYVASNYVDRKWVTMQALQVDIREHLKKKGITVSEVEQCAGLNKTTVLNILFMS